MPKLFGRSVTVQDNNVEKALRKFKKKVQASNVLNDLRAKEFYEKPTTKRKRRRSAALNRWQKYLNEQTLPKKLFWCTLRSTYGILWVPDQCLEYRKPWISGASATKSTDAKQSYNGTICVWLLTMILSTLYLPWLGCLVTRTLCLLFPWLNPWKNNNFFCH